MNDQPVPMPSPESAPEPAQSPKGKGRRGCLLAIALLIVAIIVAWAMVRPGVFTVQPIGALPDGVTLVYHSRNPEMSFFSSPDSLCLEMQGGVSLMCRAMALSAASDLTDRVILRLPYSHWAYLRSTGGLEFDK